MSISSNLNFVIGHDLKQYIDPIHSLVFFFIICWAYLVDLSKMFRRIGKGRWRDEKAREGQRKRWRKSGAKIVASAGIIEIFEIPYRLLISRILVHWLHPVPALMCRHKFLTVMGDGERGEGWGVRDEGWGVRVRVKGHVYYPIILLHTTYIYYPGQPVNW